MCDVFGVLCLECSWRRFSMGLIAALPPAYWDDAAGVALGLCVGPAKAGAPGRSIVLPAPGGARRRSGRHSGTTAPSGESLKCFASSRICGSLTMMRMTRW